MKQWITFDFLSDSEKNNYFKNIKINTSNENHQLYKDKKYILYQNGGNFPKLYFKNVTMNNVCCEIIATYNYLLYHNVTTDFFKLSAEFEKNAILNPPIISLFSPKGMWGSNPFKIEICLNYYGIKCNKYRNISELTKQIKKRGCGIISIQCSFHGLYIPIHTFTVIYDNNCYYAINRFNNHKQIKQYSSIEEIINLSKSKLLIAYV